MTRATFFKHFDLLADQPDAVAKMRELVLELAVHGKLVEQIPAEQNDSGWQQFLKSVGSRSGKRESPPFEIPKSWRWSCLDDVANYSAARKVEPSEISELDWVLDLEEIEKDSGRLLRFTTFKEKQSSSNKAEFIPGDVLYGKLRPYLNKVLVAPKAGYCTTEIVPIRSRGMIVPNYLCLFLRSPHFVAYTNTKSYGMKMPRLGTEDAISAWIAVPPPGEQRRIVAKVDELMALCDELEQQQQTAHTARVRVTASAYHHLAAAKDSAEFRRHFDFVIRHSSFVIDDVPQLRQAILQLAVQGRLVPQQRAGNGSESVRFESIIQSSRYGTAKKCDYRTSGTPVLRIPNVVGGKIDLRDLKRTELTSAERSDYRLEDGDILMVRSNGSLSLVGRAAVVSGESVGYAFAGYLVRVRLKPDVAFPAYVALALSCSDVRNQIEVPIRTTSGVKNINTQEIYRLSFPLPPLAEQKRIVARVEELLRHCDALEAQLAQTRTLGAHLLDSTLHHLLAA